MKIIGIIINAAAALLSGIIICRSVSFTEFPGGCIWNFQEKNIIIALLIMITSLLFSIAYCNGGKGKK